MPKGITSPHWNCQGLFPKFEESVHILSGSDAEIKLQNRINRFYLRVHRFAPVAAVSIEMDQPLIRCVRWGEMLRYHNRVIQMPDTRWPKIMYEFDIKKKCTTWVHEIKQICKMLHLPDPSHRVEYDMKVVSDAIMKFSRDIWWKQALEKPKLRSYANFKDQAAPTTLINANLLRYQRGLLAKPSCGILPLEIETGRYSGVKAENRLCRVCNLSEVEDEYHFLYSCPTLQTERSSFYVEHVSEFMLKPEPDKTRWLLSAEKIKATGEWVERMYNKRKSVIYK